MDLNPKKSEIIGPCYSLIYQPLTFQSSIHHHMHMRYLFQCHEQTLKKNKIPPQTSLEYFFTSQRGQDLKYLDDIKNKMVKKAK